MNQHRYILDKSSRKFPCPSCGKRRFVKYIDTVSGEYLSDEYGRCDREQSCGHFVMPPRDGSRTHEYRPVRISPKPPTSYIPYETFSKTRTAYRRNSFAKYLYTIFSDDTVNEIIVNYHIGTSKYRGKECVIFWQLDCKGRIRSGHIMLYDATGHRVKDEGQVNTWVHRVLNLEGFNLEQCFFGEHLLRNDNRPVMIVESEKTACIGSGYLPQYTWLATCGSTHFSKKAIRCHELKGRKVTVIPDTSHYEAWKQIADNFGFYTSDLLNRVATPEEIKAGLDIADYLIKYRPDEIRRPAEHEEDVTPPQPEPPQADTLPNGKYYETMKDGRTILMCKAGYPDDWNIPVADPAIVSNNSNSSPMATIRTKYPHVRELMDRLECVEAKPEGMFINADEFLNKTVSA